MLKISERATFDNLDYFLNSVREYADRKCFNKNLLMDLTLIIEELLVNTVSYGYPQKTDMGEVELSLSSTPKTIKIVIQDNGIPFNILDADTPDTNLPLRERGIGGLGIHFIKSMTDKIYYERKNGKNILILHKRQPSF